MYYARHSFATIASEDCDISLDVVGRLLGHASNTVTDIYIHRKSKKVDEALRKVLDAIK
jgi:integrase